MEAESQEMVDARREAERLMRGRKAAYARCGKCGHQRAVRENLGRWLWCEVCKWAGEPHHGEDGRWRPGRPTAAAAPSPKLKVAPAEDWRILDAVRSRSLEAKDANLSGPKRIILLEHFPTSDPEDGAFRVWFQELFEGRPWALLETAYWDDGELRVDFPPDTFKGMPSSYRVMHSLTPKVGSPLRLFREDGGLLAEYEVSHLSTVAAGEVGEFEVRFSEEGAPSTSHGDKEVRPAAPARTKTTTRRKPAPPRLAGPKRAEKSGKAKAATRASRAVRSKSTKRTTKNARPRSLLVRKKTRG